ncbi:hypothetical protein EJ05DRAFT_501076 [Pseudovirgaria hyperparasitica]|uniref:Uncharacterized protein n=1 Tax=Pseudovirgaria hyperparasitica TaxID=470096 RepID=A0A6A6W687_9PEZI|nr:uncharacterized protein EJ05DRAFT_501076 [Pseudovirgaria hyperparasitica]KAF2757544.1 hypothetical protein EJ05DRAFT_501076 [Pseudovirgaria hyperparasitica]
MANKPAYVANGEIKKSAPVTTQLSGAAGTVVLFIILYFWSLFSLDAFQAARECPYRHAVTDDRPQRNEDWGIGYRTNEFRRPRGAREGRLHLDGPTMPGPAVPCRGCGGGFI